MLPFDAAWDALKKSTFQPRSYQMSLPTEEDPKGVPLSDAVQGKSMIDMQFERGLEERMKPSKRPTKIENRQYRSDEPTGYGEFVLTDDEGDVYSILEGNVNRSPGQSKLRDIIGHTKDPYQGRGYYRALMNAALQSGYRVRSNDRNVNSQGFHEKFQQNLPPGVFFDVRNRRYGRRDDPRSDVYTYGIPQREFQRRQEAAKRQGWGDLQPDYTTFPVETIYPDSDEIESRKAKDLNQRFGMGTGPAIRPVGQMGLERFGVDIPSVPTPTYTEFADNIWLMTPKFK